MHDDFNVSNMLYISWTGEIIYQTSRGKTTEIQLCCTKAIFRLIYALSISRDGYSGKVLERSIHPPPNVGPLTFYGCQLLRSTENGFI